MQLKGPAPILGLRCTRPNPADVGCTSPASGDTCGAVDVYAAILKFERLRLKIRKRTRQAAFVDCRPYTARGARVELFVRAAVHIEHRSDGGLIVLYARNAGREQSGSRYG